jgi:hypothetical protein
MKTIFNIIETNVLTRQLASIWAFADWDDANAKMKELVANFSARGLPWRKTHTFLDTDDLEYAKSDIVELIFAEVEVK